jgi:putative nucleotidyltransferase with HDIG domain
MPRKHYLTIQALSFHLMENRVSSTTETSNSSCNRLESLLSERIEAGVIEVPLLPKVASEVLTMVYDPNAEAAKLAALIHQDQALAAHVIRVANSPAYMPRNPVVSLQHAVAMLGMNLLSEIAFTASLKNATLNVEGFDREIKSLWRHSLASGAFAKEIARMRRFNVESAYLCGLLHAIGKPVVLQTAAALAKEHQLSVEPASLDQLLNGYHIRVGSVIAKQWALPPQVAETIAFYEYYDQAAVARQECMTTCLADRLATHLLHPERLDDAAVRDHPVHADLNLYPNDIEALLQMKEKIAVVVEAMNL